MKKYSLKYKPLLEKIFSFAYLGALVFGLFFLISAPFQFYAVYQAQSAERFDAEVVYAGSGGRGDDCWFEIELLPFGSEETVVIRDIRPGDIASCGAGKSYAKQYKKGDFAVVYRTHDDDFYMEKGDYWFSSISCGLSLALYIYVIASYRRNKQAISSDKQQTESD